MAEIIKLGCLQLDRQPKGLGVKYNGEVLSFGDTDPVKAIPFVKWGNLLVAARCICANISWNELNHFGFIFGWPIRIDGIPYLCRYLKAGIEVDAPNEWDSILNDLGEDDSLWHWSGVYFWGQEILEGWGPLRVCRGCSSARIWECNNASFRSTCIGFRPVLEPLAPTPPATDTLIGTRLKIYGPNGDICGKLVDFNDYDLIVHPAPQQMLHSSCKWAYTSEENIIVDWTAIVWMKETI